MVMSKIVLLVFILGSILGLVSCKSYDVVPGAERVRVFDAEPKGCIYVGEVSSIQEDETVGTLETEMDLATRVELRNKAHALGGNVLVFLKGKNTNTLPGTVAPPLALKTGSSADKKSKSPEEKTPEVQRKEPNDSSLIVFLATAFRCPSVILNQ